MTDKKVWFITGAGRGLGVDVAKAALAAGNAVAATGREAQNGQQPGDPAKLARALVTIASQQPPPRRFIAGADAIALAEQKVKDLQEQIDAFRDLSTSLAREDA
jgi:NAD(P)-dependent dehydrogenase (short-subunit alcohol dehydrogenase family)